MLNKEDLLYLGYEINEDPDQPGKFYWKTKGSTSEMSVDSEEEAVFSASNHAWLVHDELHRCDNCGKVHANETLKIAKHLGERIDPGGVMPSGECKECGALCYPIEPDPDWHIVTGYFGLDSSFMYTDKQVMDYTRQCVESMAEADRKERMGEAAIAALARIKAHPNCRHEVEAQLGEEIWTALQGRGGKQAGDASQKVMKLLEEADSYLREIRAENLDGSEPELGELLERLTGFWIDAGLIKTVVQVERESDFGRDAAQLEAKYGAEHPSHTREVSITIEDLFLAETSGQLDGLLLPLSEVRGYCRELNVSWDYWHYGRHAEYAEELGMPDMARLFSVAWQIESRVLCEDDPVVRETAKDKIRSEYPEA